MYEQHKIFQIFFLQPYAMSGHMITSEIYLDLYSIRKAAAIFWQHTQKCDNSVSLRSGMLPVKM